MKNKILIIYPYFTDNILKIIQKFGTVAFEYNFYVILPKNVKMILYSSEQLDNFSMPSNVKVKRCYFLKIKNKNPIINPLSLFLNLLIINPEIIIVLDEVVSGNTFLVSLFNFFRKKVKIYFYGFENINKFKNWGLFKKLAFLIIKKKVKYGAICTKEAGKILNEMGYYPIVKQIWWGVDVDNFSKEISKDELKKAKRELGIPDDSYVIGYVGRFVEEKGIKDLILAFNSLNNNYYLLLIGDGSLKSLLCEKNLENKRIIILPPKTHSELVLYYKMMDVFVLPSKTTNFWKEQYGRVLIEAMSAGTRVVGSNSGSIPEIIGNCGAIFKESDIEDLKQKIILELNTQRNKKELLKRAKLGSIENFVDQWLRFIEK